MNQSAKFYVVGSPIGNLGDMTYRAVEVLKAVDLIFCEDTRHSRKLLNHYEIQKELRSAPYFKERRSAEFLLEELGRGKSIAFLCDAGTPNISDPGAILARAVRDAGFSIELVGGVSSLTYFLSGLGLELESFRFVGFLPAKNLHRRKWIESGVNEPTIFFESPHRIESTLNDFAEIRARDRLILAKELSKISERFFEGSALELKTQITSWKGEWVGIWFPESRA